MASQLPLSRRAFLRTAALASSALLVACATQNGTSSAPAVTTTPGTKTLVLEIQEFSHEALRPLLDEWSARSGYKVELTAGPNEGQTIMERLGPAFQKQTSPVDLLSLSDDAGPIMARSGWLEPLDRAVPQETWDDFPKIFNAQLDLWNGYQGQHYRLPHGFDVGYFWYRKDWFNQRGIKPPATWDELIVIGKSFTSGTVSGTLDGLKPPGLMYVYLSYLAAQAGGEIFAFDEQTAVAFQFAYDLIHKHRIMPESAITMDYGQQNTAYMNDQVAMMRQWPFFGDVARDNTAWYAPEKVEITLPPAGPVGSRSWWGSWGFSVPVYAPHKAEALDLLAWLTSIEHVLRLAYAHSWFIAPRKSILAAMGDTGLVPYIKLYIENNVVSGRPFHPQISQATGVVDLIGTLFLTKKLSLSEAMKQGTSQIAALK